MIILALLVYANGNDIYRFFINNAAMNETLERCRRNLVRRGFEAPDAATTEEARQILWEENSGRRPGNDLFRGFDDDESHGYRRMTCIGTAH